MDTSFIDRLQHLALSDDPADVTIFEAECRASMPRIIGAMEETPDDLQLYIKCVCILKEYCWESESRAVFLSHTNAIELVLIGLKLHAQDLSYTVQAYGFFVNMSIVDTNRAVIAHKGGIMTVLSSMKQFRAQVDVQKMGCMVLRNISCENAANQRNIAAAGGVNVLLDCLELHMNTFELLEQAVAALLHLCMQEDAVSCLAYEGGITLLFRVLSTQLSPLVLEEVCSILVNVALNKDARRLLVSEGGTEIILQRLQNTSVNSVIANRCIQIVGNLACVDDLRISVYERGALKVLMGIVINEESGSKTMRHCMWAVRNLITNNPDGQQFLIKDIDGVDIVINAMQQFHDDVLVLLHSCRVLWTLCYSNEECQLQAARDAMPLILHGMSQHPENPELLAQFASLIVNLTINADTHKSFHMEDGISTIVDAMKSHMANAAIFGRCCRILVNVSNEGGEEVQDELIESDIVTLLIGGIEHNPDDPDLVMKACKLLTTLTAVSTEVQIAVAQKGGVGVLVSASKLNMEEPELLKYFVSVLLNVSMNDSTHAAMRTDGGIELLMAVMNNYYDVHDLMSRACRSLGNLVGGSADAGGELLSLGDVRILVKVMEAHVDDAEISVLCCWMLDELSNKESKLEGIFHAGGLDIVVATLQRHATDTRVVKHALEVLVNYSCSLSPDHRYLIPEEAIATVIEQLRVMPTDVKELCCIIIGNLAQRDKDEIQEQGVVNLIVDILNSNQSAEELQVEGWSCLSKIAAAVNDWSLIDRVGGIQALIKLQITHPHLPNVQIACARAFRALASLQASARSLIAEGGIPPLLQCFLNTADPVVQEHVLLALALIAHHGTMAQLQQQGMERQLISLSNNLLMNSTDGKLLSITCLLVGGLGEKIEMQGTLVHHNTWHNLLNCIERCARVSSISIYDYNSLRIMCGYAICAIVVNNQNVRHEILRYEDVADFVWFTARELQEAVDVQQEYSLDKLHIDICGKVIDIMGTIEIDEAHIIPRGATKPWAAPTSDWDAQIQQHQHQQQQQQQQPQLTQDEREQHRAQQQEAYDQQQYATEHTANQQRAHDKPGEYHAMPAPPIPDVVVDSKDEAYQLWRKMGILPEDLRKETPNNFNEAVSRQRADYAEHLYQSLFDAQRPTSSQAFTTDSKRVSGTNPVDLLEQQRLFRRERAMWEEQEEWERKHVVEGESESRRRIEVRIATLLQTMYQQQTTAFQAMVGSSQASSAATEQKRAVRQELAKGSQWLNSLNEKATKQKAAAVEKRQFKFPPRPAKEAEIPGRKGTPDSNHKLDKKDSKSKLAGYHGAEMTAGYSAAESGGSAAGNLQEQGGGVIGKVGSGGGLLDARQKAASASMPGYIYSKEDPGSSIRKKTPPMMTDAYRSVQVPSYLPPQ